MRFLIQARNRQVGIEEGIIVEPDGRFDDILELPQSDVRPGLINSHDHLHRNHYGRLGAPPYRNAYEWARDIQVRHRRLIEARHRMPRRDALLIGAWKNLRSGVTTVAHHDQWEPTFEDEFPLHVPRVENYDSLGMSDAVPRPDPCAPFMIHLAEGTDSASEHEVERLDELGLLTPKLIAIHGVAMRGEGLARFRASGAALVWCPSSNLFLFDQTCPESVFQGDVDILLGTDSLLTGAGDLLDELRVARSLGLLDDERLEASVGAVAARRLGIPLPSFEVGSPADLIVLSRPLLEARANDVQLVLVGGSPRIIHPELAPALRATGKVRRHMAPLFAVEPRALPP